MCSRRLLSPPKNYYAGGNGVGIQCIRGFSCAFGLLTQDVGDLLRSELKQPFCQRHDIGACGSPGNNGPGDVDCDACGLVRVAVVDDVADAHGITDLSLGFQEFRPDTVRQ
ncbi:hypothetical protein CKJ66_04830 [Mycobacterium avium]|uniref:Uncharacterized protein n=1 Tax=Mycobacterium avium TaxID=1764 RepID=A0A2A2ZN19_MYCAV|nr:hypothetical protein CKJ66_04830 [Mycobacterium avium]